MKRNVKIAPIGAELDLQPQLDKWVEELKTKKLTCVPCELIETFWDYAVEQGLRPCGGALNFEEGGDSQFFYID